MWVDANYCWVVLCKNHWFHMRQNIFFRHRIPLSQTDAVSALPPLSKPFTASAMSAERRTRTNPRTCGRWS